MSDDEPSPSPYRSDDSAWRSDLGGYLVTFETEGHPAYEFVLTNLAGPQEQYDIATLRFNRQGGMHDADRAHQQNLLVMVGAITVLAGHIEAEMKRILLRAEGDEGSTFADVDLTWTDLEKRLGRVGQQDSDIGRATADAIAWGHEHDIKKIRDNVVHSAWCLFDIGHFQGGRFSRRSTGATLMVTGKDLAKYVNVMSEYRNRLENVVRWPLAFLPPLGPDAPIKTVEVDYQEVPPAD